MKINLCEAKYKVTDGEHTIYVVNQGESWSIVTNFDDKDFVFCDYIDEGGLETAETIIKLLQKAVKFIKKNIKESE